MRIRTITDNLTVGYAIFGVFFMTGSFVAILSSAGEDSSPRVQALAALIGLIACLHLLIIPQAIQRILGSYWLTLLPVLFAAASITWSDDPTLSVRRIIALLLTTGFAYWLAFRFSGRDIFKIVYWSVVIAIVANFAIVFVNPAVGIHQATDLHAAHHYGSWRGLFAHKNDFGRFISFGVCILVMGLAERYGSARWRFMALILIALCFFMIAKSKSSQAVLLAVAIPAGYLTIRLMKNLTPVVRAIIMTAMVPTVLLIAAFGPRIFELILLALGRDTTLTGRTEIWMGTIYALRSNIFMGGGFGAGWDVVGERLYIMSGVLIGHAHNGYLDLVCDIGVVGLALAVLVVLVVFFRGFFMLMQDRESGIASLSIIVTLFILVGNWAGSFLMLHNSVYWVLPITCYVALTRLTYHGTQPSSWSYRPAGVGVQ